jgi:hypothetical protein
MVIFAGGLSWKRTSKRTRFLLLACGVSLLGLAAEVFFAPHYGSPLTGVILALVLLAMRRLQVWRRWGRPCGLFITRAIPLVCVVMFALRCLAGPLHLPLTRAFAAAWHQAAPKIEGRAAVLAELQRLPGKHLVIVRYTPDHFLDDEWVYNDADIDAARVVWAREMASPENEELIHYFQGRRVWLLEADQHPPKLLPHQCLLSGMK